MEALLQFLNSVHPLSNELISHLHLILKADSVSKKEYVLKAGQVCNKIYFIDKGLFKCYYLHKQKEHITWFMKEADVIVSVKSFFRQVKSIEYIQALEDSELYYITYDELQYIYRHFPEFNFIGRIVTENYYCMSEERAEVLRMKKISEQYRWFQERYADFMPRLTNKEICHFLNFTEEALSRVRGNHGLS